MIDTEFRVLDSSQPNERQDWLDHWNSWAAREVQAHPAYVSLFAEEHSRALAAVVHSDAGSVLFPFVLRRVPSTAAGQTDLTDIITPYGYGGAYAWDVVDRNALAHDFWRAFAGWSVDNRVVTEFVRLSLFDDALLPYPTEPTVKQDNIVVDLGRTPEDLWMSFEHKVRKNVNKARRSGIEVRVDTTGALFDDFASIYTATMDRRGAASSYYFGPDFFATIHGELPGQFVYFHALQDNIVVSTELVLLSAKSVYSFLGGTLGEAFASRPNDALKVEIMRWAAESGRRWFVLGGGYAPDDGIFRYKRAFAPDGVRPFKVGTRIINDEEYRRLSHAHAASSAASDRDGFFPAYRA